jgi:Domain of unknown function (DUF4397)
MQAGRKRGLMNVTIGVLGAARSAAALVIVLAAASGAAVLAADPAGASAVSPVHPVSPMHPVSPPHLASPVSPASAAGYGWLRLAHLSPNTPPVDVYLYSVGAAVAKIVLKHVAYGTESPYERVRSGDYTVAMRPAGAPAASKPVLSTLVDVVAGRAYTVAGMGPFKALRLEVLQDQLSTPPGEALVRIIQASLLDKQVSVRLGRQTIARQLRFGTATSYLTVTPGTGTLHVTGGSAQASSQVSFTAGSIHTLVVLDDPGHLQIQVLEDAAGSSAVPVGAADTGFGGTAARPGPAVLPWCGAALLGLLLAGGGAAAMRSRRKAAHARAR